MSLLYMANVKEINYVMLLKGIYSSCGGLVENTLDEPKGKFHITDHQLTVANSLTKPCTFREAC